MESADAERLAAGRMPVDDFYDRHLWIKFVVNGAALLALLLGLLLHMPSVVKIVLLAVASGLVSRRVLHCRGPAARRELG